MTKKAGKGRHIDVEKESGGLFHTFLHTTALTDHESLWKKTEENPSGSITGPFFLLIQHPSLCVFIHFSTH